MAIIKVKACPKPWGLVIAAALVFRLGKDLNCPDICFAENRN